MTDTNPNVPVKMFDESAGQALAAANDAAAVARATQEIQAALVIAQRCPRDEIKAKAKIMIACQRRELALDAEYEYSRGGTRITGPTIDLLRAIANRWGNVRFGWTEVERKEGVSLVRCFAWDMQTNSQAERTFSVRHWRDTREGGKALTDERDIYELLANMAARRVRACLEEVIDSDIVTAAVDQCRSTLKNGEKVPLADRAAKMVVAYMEFGVTRAMLETRLGNKLEAISENQFGSLTRVYKALRDGVGRVEDYFKPETSRPEFAGSEEAATSTAPGSTKADQGPAPGGDAGGGNPPASSPVTPAPAAEPPSVLHMLRLALKSGKISESVLLEFWSTTGATDGSQGSLEEVQLVNPALIKHTADSWFEIRDKLVELRESKRKKP